VSSKRVFSAAVLLLLLALQWPLWAGKGSWWEARKTSALLQQQDKLNDDKRERNSRLASDVKDLQNDGSLAAESQARRELGMIKSDEVFVQITPTPGSGAASAASVSNAASTPKPAVSR
jgi:cell division protein FtsB